VKIGNSIKSPPIGLPWVGSLLVLVFMTYLIHDAWTLLSDNSMLAPFPFSDQEITRTSYWFAACGYLIWVILFYVIYELFTGYRDVMKWFLAFQILEFFEYFLTYNEPLVFLPNPINPVANLFSREPVTLEAIGINITSIKIVTMFFVVLRKLWISGKQ
jgi:hypothetical protein